MRKVTDPIERDEQIALFQWAKLNTGKYPCLKYMYHIPNGGSRNKIEAANLKRQGVKRGVPDICLPAPCGGYNGLYIELKRQKSGKLSEDQKDWIEVLNNNGYLATVCHGWEQAKNTILKYLEGRE